MTFSCLLEHLLHFVQAASCYIKGFIFTIFGILCQRIGRSCASPVTKVGAAALSFRLEQQPPMDFMSCIFTSGEPPTYRHRRPGHRPTASMDGLNFRYPPGGLCRLPVGLPTPAGHGSQGEYGSYPWSGHSVPSSRCRRLPRSCYACSW